MQSLQINKIDGFDVIIGFQNRPIDPVETRKQNTATILGTDEKLVLTAKQEEQDRFMIKLGEARKKAIYHLRLANGYIEVIDDIETLIPGVDVAKNTVASENQDKIALGHVGTLNTINEELKSFALAINEKAKEILRGNPVFFEARENEVIKSQTELDDLNQKFAGKTENQALLEDGSFVDDFRGTSYHKKTSGTWAETPIIALAVKKATSTKYTDELTDTEKTEIADQKEDTRVTALSAEEKTAEYDAKVESLLSESVTMRGELEIQGVSAADALTQSQAFYDTELDKLQTKYGVV